jgi:hypothetical protein
LSQRLCLLGKRLFGFSRGIRRATIISRIHIREGFGEFIGNQQARHHQQSRVTDLTDGRHKLLYPLIDESGELEQMIFLPVITGDAVGLAVYRNINLGHCSLPEYYAAARWQNPDA